jgi:hypothetical protein
MRTLVNISHFPTFAVRAMKIFSRLFVFVFLAAFVSEVVASVSMEAAENNGLNFHLITKQDSATGIQNIFEAFNETEEETQDPREELNLSAGIFFQSIHAQVIDFFAAKQYQSSLSRFAHQLAIYTALHAYLI